jgi:hypothetical protein
MPVDPDLPNLHGASDPRGSRGDIAGPGGPFDRDAVVVDTTNAVILDYSTVSTVEAVRGGETETVIALMLEGRVNRSTDRTRVLYLMNGDGAAAIVTELLGIAKRAERGGDSQLADEFRGRLGERWDEMPT